jgi:hypothetical protein
MWQTSNCILTSCYLAYSSYDVPFVFQMCIYEIILFEHIFLWSKCIFVFCFFRWRCPKKTSRPLVNCDATPLSSSPTKRKEKKQKKTKKGPPQTTHIDATRITFPQKRKLNPEKSSCSRVSMFHLLIHEFASPAARQACNA